MWWYSRSVVSQFSPPMNILLQGGWMVSMLIVNSGIARLNSLGKTNENMLRWKAGSLIYQGVVWRSGIVQACHCGQTWSRNSIWIRKPIYAGKSI
jgi:hypothetical protein